MGTGSPRALTPTWPAPWVPGDPQRAPGAPQQAPETPPALPHKHRAPNPAPEPPPGHLLRAREWSGLRMPLARSFCSRVTEVSCFTRYTDSE